jgi:SSS family solute:Na+ symporter
MNESTSILGPFDWLVIIGYAVGVLGIGWYYNRRNRNTEDYLVGGRQMRPFAVGLSYFVALFSTITYLSIPGEIIRHGPMVLAGLLALPLVVPLVGWTLIPVFMRQNVTSGYELLELRLGRSVQLLGVCFFLAMRLLWMGVIIYATVDKVLMPLTGLPQAAAQWICLGLAGLTIIYTAMGGLQAVIIVDAFQAILLFGGVVATLVIITVALGGVGAWWPDHWLTTWDQPSWVSGSKNGRSVLGAAAAMLVWWVATAGSDQVAIQRYLATRDARDARRMLGVSVCASITIQLLLGCLGLSLLVYATVHPQWIPSGRTILDSADQLFPRFIATALPAGISGLIIAGMLAEAMNSLASGINSVSCVVVTDLFGLSRRGNPNNAAANLRIVRWVSVCVGLLVVALSTGVRYVQGNLLELAYKIVNLLTVPLFGIFVMALFVRWATPFGTFVSAFAGFAIVAAINFWRELTGQPEPPVSFLWAMPLALPLQVMIGMIVSLFPVGAPQRLAAARGIDSE